jgi:hypothetical protein
MDPHVDAKLKYRLMILLGMPLFLTLNNAYSAFKIVLPSLEYFYSSFSYAYKEKCAYAAWM